ncbi:MAG: hypothetical protein IMZ61_03305 [Planctomycetes bacterium]|nr:hypothetical protein [Planctomycetota bacterium]
MADWDLLSVLRGLPWKAPDLGVVERGLPGYACSLSQIREFTTGILKEPILIIHPAGEERT